MKISRDWLQTFFDSPLPDAEKLSDLLTFHAFEIESIENDILDVKVTPNRGHDCLSHRGIARELSAILNIPTVADPFRAPAPLEPDLLHKNADTVYVGLEDTKLCKRYLAGYITGVKVGPSPDWLRTSLESIGQKSINNVVDATNYVMFTLGQPLHAFDAGKLKKATVDGDENYTDSYSIVVRRAKKGEKLLALDEKEYALTPDNLVIIDGNADAVIGIAGVKGGMPAGITEQTTDIILESANFNGVSVRKTAAALKLRTDASARFEQVISPELAAYGMRAAAELIFKIAGGEVVGFADVYPTPQEKTTVSVSLEKVNRVLGMKLGASDVADAFTRLGLPFEQKGEVFTVTPPFERLDLVIPEDLVEEVGRIVGYDKVPSTPLPSFEGKPEINKNFAVAESRREELMAQGYSEVLTSVFADAGERVVANKVDGVRPYLRATLVDGLKEAYEKNLRNKDLLGLTEVRIFEIGTVWKGGKEIVMVGTADSPGASETPLQPKEAEAYENLPLSEAQRYRTFSKYPFIVRDIALWVPAETKSEGVLDVIRKSAGDLLVRSEKFDEFKKGERISYAFRLVFQSFDRTLTDEDANSRMESVNAAVKKEGWEVR